jgi:hypothetical protein
MWAITAPAATILILRGGKTRVSTTSQKPFGESPAMLNPSESALPFSPDLSGYVSNSQTFYAPLHCPTRLSAR